MGIRSKTSTAQGRDETLGAISKALRERSARQMADARTPENPATGTERISRLLAEARAERDAPKRLPLAEAADES